MCCTHGQSTSNYFVQSERAVDLYYDTLQYTQIDTGITGHQHKSCSKLLQLSICNSIAQLKLPGNSFQTSGMSTCYCRCLVLV
jgi:hypothetical protein